MVVVKIYMWPGGDQSRERLLSQASIACIGEASQDQGDVRRGERAYRVRLFKDTSFRGPRDGEDLARLPRSKVWREGTVRGHRPGQRGAWDLVGGALQVLLGRRLRPYVDLEER